MFFVGPPTCLKGKTTHGGRIRELCDVTKSTFPRARNQWALAFWILDWAGDVKDEIFSGLSTSPTDHKQMLELMLKKMSHKLGAFTWRACDNDNGIRGAWNMCNTTHITEIDTGTALCERGSAPSLQAEAFFFYWLITCWHCFQFTD